MYVLSSSFDPELATNSVQEALNLGENAEALAEKLGWYGDMELITAGIKYHSFKKLVQEVMRVKAFLDIEKKIADVQSERYAFRFLGTTYRENQVERLNEEKRQLGPLLDAPIWFFQQPRVVLLSTLRDFGLDNSLQSDVKWINSAKKPLYFPLVEMFENGDVATAKLIAAELEKPLKNIQPRFILEKFEGHRSISFDFTTGTALFYNPVKKG